VKVNIEQNLELIDLKPVSGGYVLILIMNILNFELSKERRIKMLWTISVILIVLWLLGIVTSTTIGGYINLLLVIAVIIVLIKIIQGKRIL
jgi:hypothetical protein